MPFRPPPPDPAERLELSERAGLCAGCCHLQVLRSRDRLFVRCALSDVEASFPRYPVLPVGRCPGYHAAEGLAAVDTASAPR